VLAPRPKLVDATAVSNPPLSIVSSGDTWQMMVATVRRAIRLTQPPVTERTKSTEAIASSEQRRRDGLWLEDHYALLLAAGY
jgi:hypothetical protein